MVPTSACNPTFFYPKFSSKHHVTSPNESWLLLHTNFLWVHCSATTLQIYFPWGISPTLQSIRKCNWQSFTQHNSTYKTTEREREISLLHHNDLAPTTLRLWCYCFSFWDLLLIADFSHFNNTTHCFCYQSCFPSSAWQGWDKLERESENAGKYGWCGHNVSLSNVRCERAECVIAGGNNFPTQFRFSVF